MQYKKVQTWYFQACYQLLKFLLTPVRILIPISLTDFEFTGVWYFLLFVLLLDADLDGCFLSPAYKVKTHDYRLISLGYLRRISKINFTNIPYSALTVVGGPNQQRANCWTVGISLAFSFNCFVCWLFSWMVDCVNVCLLAWFVGLAIDFLKVCFRGCPVRSSLVALSAQKKTT